MRPPMLSNKELAAEMACCLNTLRRRRRRLRLRPTFGGQNGHRWSRAAADEFIRRWAEFSQRQKAEL